MKKLIKIFKNYNNLNKHLNMIIKLFYLQGIFLININFKLLLENKYLSIDNNSINLKSIITKHEFFKYTNLIKNEYISVTLNDDKKYINKDVIIFKSRLKPNHNYISLITKGIIYSLTNNKEN